MEIKNTITITDVAKKAGVSISTVSRVLNNPSQVKKETSQRVNAAIKELKFTSNSLQFRYFNSQDKYVIIFMPSIISECVAEIAQGAMDELERQNVFALIWNSNENTLTEQRGYSMLHQSLAQGAIFVTCCIEDFSMKDVISEVPVAAIERTIGEPSVDVINADSEHGMDLLVDHLYQLGHRSFGFLCGDISSSYTLAKTMAYKKALAQRGIEWDASSVISSGWTLQCGYEGFQQLYSWRPQTTAVICITDVLASGAINAIHSMGYKCPEDISVVGFHNMPSSAYLWPKLTTLDFPSYEMGKLAAKKILLRMEDPEVSVDKIILPVKLIQRDSTGIVRLR